MASEIASDTSLQSETKATDHYSNSLSIVASSTEDAAMRNNLSVRTKPQGTQDSPPEPGTPGTLVTQMGTTLTPRGGDQPQDQLELLLAELGRIEGNQQKLRDAVKHNKAIVVHPRLELLQEEESEADTPKVATPKQLVVSGGLTGFGIAKDLLQIDFSPPEEVPEEFKATAWDTTPKKAVKPTSTNLISEGSFGVCDPESTEMRDYLERLEQQQQRILELITGKKQELAEKLQEKSEAKPKRIKSRLGKNNRLPATQDKQALSNLLRIPAAEDISNGYEQTAKGALVTKMPVIPQPANNVQVMNVLLPDLPEISPSPVPEAPKVRPAVQQPARRAQVQAADLERKEQEEMLAQFGTPLPGSTPSTMHLAGAIPKSRAQPEESTAMPYYATSPQESRRTSVSPKSEVQQAGEKDSDKPKSIIRGLKKLLSKNKA